MSSNQFSAGIHKGPTAREIRLEQERAFEQDRKRDLTVAALRDQRSIGTTRRRIDIDEA